MVLYTLLYIVMILESVKKVLKCFRNLFMSKKSCTFALSNENDKLIATKKTN